MESMSGSGDTSTNAHWPAASQSGMFQPSDAILLRMSSGVSSKGDENAVFPALSDSFGKKLRDENRFRAACRAGNKRCAPFRQSSIRNLVKPCNAGRQFLNHAEALLKFGCRGSGVRVSEQCAAHQKSTPFFERAVEVADTRTPTPRHPICSVPYTNGKRRLMRQIREATGNFHFFSRITQK